jgi:hypothetical protein
LKGYFKNVWQHVLCERQGRLTIHSRTIYDVAGHSYPHFKNLQTHYTSFNIFLSIGKILKHVYNFLVLGGVLLYTDNNDMERIIITRIIKTGTSLCVVIPKNILNALNWERGDQVVFGICDSNTITINKLSQSDLLKLKLPHENI